MIKGSTHSLETRQKLSKAHRALGHTLETRKKMSESRKGHATSLETRQRISDAQKGRIIPVSARKKMRGKRPQNSGDNNYLWKGENVSYVGIHLWIYRELGKASKCEFADETCSKHFQWSNISGEYKRDVDDFQQLCVSHHKRYDLNRLNLVGVQ